mgnify:CR=1 FL=1
MKKKLLFLFAALLSTALFSQELQNSVNKINNDKIIIQTQLNERFVKYSKMDSSQKYYSTLADVKNNKEILFNKYTAPFEIQGKFHIPVQETNHGFYLTSDLKEYIFKDKNYKKVFPYCNGSAFVLDKDENYVLIDMKGNTVTDQVEFTTGRFGEGLAPVKLKDGRTGYMNPKGKLVLELDFNFKYNGNCYYATRFNNGYAIVNDGNDFDYSVIDKKGNRIKKINAKIYSDEFSGLVTFCVPAEREGLYAFGFMKTDGEVVFPPKYRFADGPRTFPSFMNGMTNHFYTKDGIPVLMDKYGNVYNYDDYRAGITVYVEDYFDNLEDYKIEK